VSENVILIRFLKDRQRAHRDVRESEHTHGCKRPVDVFMQPTVSVPDGARF